QTLPSAPARLPAPSRRSSSHVPLRPIRPFARAPRPKPADEPPSGLRSGLPVRTLSVSVSRQRGDGNVQSTPAFGPASVRVGRTVLGIHPEVKIAAPNPPGAKKLLRAAGGRPGLALPEPRRRPDTKA